MKVERARQEDDARGHRAVIGSGAPAAKRFLAQGIGELCITLGVVILLYVVYQMFWTNVVSSTTTQSEIDKIKNQWATQQQALGDQQGASFAVLHIPRLGHDFMKPVLQGTDLDTLAKGVGHYDRTVMPGQVGNFAVAGHRGGHGEPFRHLDQLEPGDAVVVETASTWYTYRVRKGPYITKPSDIAVVYPVPRASGFTQPGKYITLTTCDPWWSSERRMIFWGDLESEQPKLTGPPVALQ
jgi:sortase A